MYIVKKYKIDNYHEDFSCKRKFRNYNFSDKYANKSIGQSIMEYFGQTYFNCLPYKYKNLKKNKRISI